ncbi:hypothetical protein Pyn_26665 [Prunus yedoensis var. nudiflora]|uniref:Uncharacterized protein n=1 Tax=Prunus yedoensis var. nudiflora TaxID=2094558 RepID=A0A314USG1_PRUYE|nr:hypothetical protein Pyn_26665 [Prunus yedoensis var. nudiflora]
MDPKVRVAHNYCKHGDVHDHPCGTCRDLFDVGPETMFNTIGPRPLLPKAPISHCLHYPQTGARIATMTNAF